jgi:hypothetical protein
MLQLYSYSQNFVPRKFLERKFKCNASIPLFPHIEVSTHCPVTVDLPDGPALPKISKLLIFNKTVGMKKFGFRIAIVFPSIISKTSLMLHQNLLQKQQGKILPQQIQLLNLFHLNTIQLEHRLQQELKTIRSWKKVIPRMKTT